MGMFNKYVVTVKLVAGGYRDMKVEAKTADDAKGQTGWLPEVAEVIHVTIDPKDY